MTNMCQSIRNQYQNVRFENEFLKWASLLLKNGILTIVRFGCCSPQGACLLPGARLIALKCNHWRVPACARTIASPSLKSLQ